MMGSTAEIMNRGMRCLVEQMGIIEAEQFISVIICEKFDYTKWQGEYFDAKTPTKISEEASQYEKTIRLQGMQSGFSIISPPYSISNYNRYSLI